MQRASINWLQSLLLLHFHYYQVSKDPPLIQRFSEFMNSSILTLSLMKSLSLKKIKLFLHNKKQKCCVHSESANFDYSLHQWNDLVMGLPTG